MAILKKLCRLLALIWPLSAFAGDLPDHAKTPGFADPLLDVSKLCDKSFHTGTIRNVGQSLKNKIYASYGMSAKKKPCPCEIDHLISLELGGSNDERNLWPQSYNTKPWNAHVKDKLENKLHELVCAGKVPLAIAQHEIATNWTVAYKKWMPQ